MNGELLTSLDISSVAMSDDGQVKVTATNRLGVVSNSCHLTVISKYISWFFCLYLDIYS